MMDHLRSKHHYQLKSFKDIVSNKFPDIKKQLKLERSSALNPLVHESWNDFSAQIFDQVLGKPRFGFFRAPIMLKTMTGLHYQAKHGLLREKIEQVFGVQTA
jgi:hypothetical protein